MSIKLAYGKRVHYMNDGGGDYTLCGLGADEPYDHTEHKGKPYHLENTEKKVNCPDCLSHIKYVKGLK